MPKKRSSWKKRRKWRDPRPKTSRKAKVTPLPEGEARDEQALARLAEGVWRLKRRAASQDANERDWAETIISGLEHDLQDLGVETIDRTGTKFTLGETIQVAHSDAPPGFAGDLTITTVVRPTIRIAGKVLQAGQVVLGPAEQ